MAVLAQGIAIKIYTNEIESRWKWFLADQQLNIEFLSDLSLDAIDAGSDQVKSFIRASKAFAQ